MDDGWRKVEAGACGAWPLPADATCARVARRLFRRTASALALDAEAVDDGEAMVSELAANTLHAQCDSDDERDRPDERDQRDARGRHEKHDRREAHDRRGEHNRHTGAHGHLARANAP